MLTSQENCCESGAKILPWLQVTQSYVQLRWYYDTIALPLLPEGRSEVYIEATFMVHQ